MQVPKVVKAWHEQMVEMIIMEPSITNEELAVRLEMAPITISLVRRSDMFQLLYRERFAEVREFTNTRVKDRLEGRLANLADQGIDNLQLRLEQEKKLLESGMGTPSRETRETVEMALEALGYIGKKGAAAQPVGQVNVDARVIVDGTLLANARQQMRDRGRAKRDDEQHYAALPSPA